MNLSRRSLLAVIASSVLSACTQIPKPEPKPKLIEPIAGNGNPPGEGAGAAVEPTKTFDYAKAYAPGTS